MTPQPRPLNRWDVAKLIALGLMFIDHAGHFFFPDELWLRAIGRSCAPIFLFLTGFASHYHFRMDVLILALLLTVSDFALDGPNKLNILFSILGCRMLFAWLEQRGKAIERPFEWYVASMAMIISIAFVQYASFAVIFGVSGYMMRHGSRYSAGMQRAFLLLAMASYAVVYGALFEFSASNWLLMLLCLGVTGWGLATMNTRLDVQQILPAPVASVAVFIARHSVYIYALHLIALEWITRIPL